jgi:hypothetical protein
MTTDDFINTVVEALGKIDPADPATKPLSSYFYVADTRIRALLSELHQLIDKGTGLTRTEQQLAGVLMEQIAFLAFAGVRGVRTLKSFQSAGPQYDLLISGDSPAWFMLCKLLYLDERKRSILVEAKAIGSRLSDKQFARLCAIMDTNLPLVGLGVFFTIAGASGFPEGLVRQRSIRDCRLRQVLYHAKTGQSVVVLDRGDLEALTVNGAFIDLLMRKVRDISELTGLPADFSDDLQERADLPPHLAELQ